MTISIVSQLTASSLAATTAGSRTDEAPSADLGAVVADFASLLAAFAVDTRSSQKPPEDQNQTDATAQILADAPPTPGLADALAVQAWGHRNGAQQHDVAAGFGAGTADGLSTGLGHHESRQVLARTVERQLVGAEQRLDGRPVGRVGLAQ